MITKLSSFNKGKASWQSGFQNPPLLWPLAWHFWQLRCSCTRQASSPLTALLLQKAATAMVTRVATAMETLVATMETLVATMEALVQTAIPVQRVKTQVLPKLRKLKKLKRFRMATLHQSWVP